MTNKITELDKAEIRHTARGLFLDHGCLEVLTESIMFGQIMLEVLREENQSGGNVDEHR